MLADSETLIVTELSRLDRSATEVIALVNELVAWSPRSPMSLADREDEENELKSIMSQLYTGVYISDVLATVRRHLWDGSTFQTSATDPDVCLVPHTHLGRLVQATCY